MRFYFLVALTLIAMSSTITGHKVPSLPICYNPTKDITTGTPCPPIDPNGNIGRTKQ